MSGGNRITYDMDLLSWQTIQYWELEVMVSGIDDILLGFRLAMRSTVQFHLTNGYLTKDQVNSIEDNAKMIWSTEYLGTLS